MGKHTHTQTHAVSHDWVKGGKSLTNYLNGRASEICDKFVGASYFNIILSILAPRLKVRWMMEFLNKFPTRFHQDA